MTQTSTDPRSLLATAVATADAAIAAVRFDQMHGPTPCDEYDVQALLGHLITVITRVAVMGEGGDPMDVPRVVTGVADDGWHDAWTAGVHRAAAAWTDDATLERTIVLPWVTANGATILGMYTAEVTVHTWDLARATGQNPAWDAQVVDASMESGRGMLHPGDREAAFEAMRPNLPAFMAGMTRPFGNAIDTAGAAAPIDQLVAWYGRRPQSTVGGQA
jgi:uncharacterized protein (TIGR03086 family)